jgi:hypothetical protein
VTSGLLSSNRIITDFLGDSARRACYSYVNTWGDIILGNYYIPRLVVSGFFFVSSVFFAAVIRRLQGFGLLLL